MKIRSNFKDYYDYLAYQYGVDENIVFRRNFLTPVQLDGYAYENMSEEEAVEKCRLAYTENPNFFVNEESAVFFEDKQKKYCFDAVNIINFNYSITIEYDKFSKKLLHVFLLIMIMRFIKNTGLLLIHATYGMTIAY